MYKIQSVIIDNFWGKFNAHCDFDDNVNIIIGRNGTGKTTFMNILQSVLSVDIDGIMNTNFDRIEIKLKHNNSIKTIKARKIENPNFPIQTLEYQISQSKYQARLIPSDDRRMSPGFRRRMQEECEQIKIKLAELVSLSSLSVYRLRNGQDYEVRDKNGTRAIAPVDFKLGELLQDLTHYQLDLSQKARDVATKLQKDVLASILYSKEDLKHKGYILSYDKEKERTDLVAAYKRLNAIDDDVKQKINFHVGAIDEAIKKINNQSGDINFASLEALRKTQSIIKMSLKAEEETSHIFAQITLFLETLRSFIPDKTFQFIGGLLKISSLDENIDCSELSSGEKQLLILFIETLLQRQKPFVFLTDEPELSLHIAWQRKIIPAIRHINPNAQIIAATHSPEIASNYKNFIYNMENLIRE